MKKIVVGFDGSPVGRKALEWARDEGRQWDAEVVVVHAWEFTPLVVATDAPVDLPELKRASAATVARAVDEVWGDDAASVTQQVVEKIPAQAVLDAAEDGADLVVVGSRGLGGFKGLLLGSVSDKISHHCPCPVVIVRGPDH
jgi:nucleotide-binding universal stress UspA family protein